VINTGLEVAKGFTETFGKALSAPSQKVATSTTRIATPQTIASTISNVSLPASTFRTLGRRGLPEGMKATVYSAKPPERGQLNGTDQKREGYGIAATPRGLKAGPSGSGKTSLVSIAGRYLRRLFAKAGIRRNTAPTFPRPRTIESVRHLKAKEDVWCITVPGVEAFALSNGAVVHNCSHLADAFRYLSLSWQAIPEAAVSKAIEAPPGYIIPPPVNSGRRQSRFR